MISVKLAGNYELKLRSDVVNPCACRWIIFNSSSRIPLIAPCPKPTPLIKCKYLRRQIVVWISICITLIKNEKKLYSKALLKCLIIILIEKDEKNLPLSITIHHCNSYSLSIFFSVQGSRIRTWPVSDLIMSQTQSKPTCTKAVHLFLLLQLLLWFEPVYQLDREEFHIYSHSMFLLKSTCISQHFNIFTKTKGPNSGQGNWKLHSEFLVVDDTIKTKQN